MITTDAVKGKRVVITGATAGIGKATAEIFAAAGSDLIITGRRSERLLALKEELESQYDIRVEVAAFDVRDLKACKNFSKKIDASTVDILINNAGLALGKEAIYEADVSDWDTMIDTNVKGLLYLSRYFSEAFREKNSGHIINIGSVAGLEGYAGGVVYSATKFAVRAITEATKKDLHGTKVRVSLIAPGLLESEFSEVRFKGDKKKAKEVYKNTQPLKPEDIAEVILFTASRPDHVNIFDMVVYATYQSGPVLIHRDDS